MLPSNETLTSTEGSSNRDDRELERDRQGNEGAGRRPARGAAGTCSAVGGNILIELSMVGGQEGKGGHHCCTLVLYTVSVRTISDSVGIAPVQMNCGEL